MGYVDMHRKSFPFGCALTLLDAAQICGQNKSWVFGDSPLESSILTKLGRNE
jgi:hypothetical protein